MFVCVFVLFQEKCQCQTFQLTQAGIEGVETAMRLTTHTFSSVLLLPTFLCYSIFFLSPLHPPPVLPNYCLSFLPSLTSLFIDSHLLFFFLIPLITHTLFMLSPYPHYSVSFLDVRLMEATNQLTLTLTYWTVSTPTNAGILYINLFCCNLRHGVFVIVVVFCLIVIAFINIMLAHVENLR